MQSAGKIKSRRYRIRNFSVYAVELVHGERHAVLYSWDTPSPAVREIFQDRSRRRFAIDRLFMVHHVLDSLQQRLRREVMRRISYQYRILHVFFKTDTRLMAHSSNASCKLEIIKMY